MIDWRTLLTIVWAALWTWKSPWSNSAVTNMTTVAANNCSTKFPAINFGLCIFSLCQWICLTNNTFQVHLSRFANPCAKRKGCRKDDQFLKTSRQDSHEAKVTGEAPRREAEGRWETQRDGCDEKKMEPVKCSNCCSLDRKTAFHTGRFTAGEQFVFSSNMRILDLSSLSGL